MMEPLCKLNVITVGAVRYFVEYIPEFNGGNILN